jgi:hypothetical protein
MLTLKFCWRFTNEIPQPKDAWKMHKTDVDSSFPPKALSFEWCVWIWIGYICLPCETPPVVGVAWCYLCLEVMGYTWWLRLYIFLSGESCESLTDNYCSSDSMCSSHLVQVFRFYPGALMYPCWLPFLPQHLLWETDIEFVTMACLAALAWLRHDGIQWYCLSARWYTLFFFIYLHSVPLCMFQIYPLRFIKDDV